MKIADKFYFIIDLNIYAEITDEKNMNNITIHRDSSKTKSCLSKVALGN